MFFLKLSEDDIRNIAKFLTFNELLKFTYINSLCNKAIDNNFYHNLALKLYSNNFWNSGINKSHLISMPFFNYKKELLRIENYQNSLDKMNINRWTNKDFYNYWKSDSDKLLYMLTRPQ